MIRRTRTVCGETEEKEAAASRETEGTTGRVLRETEETAAVSRETEETAVTVRRETEEMTGPVSRETEEKEAAARRGTEETVTSPGVRIVSAETEIRAAAEMKEVPLTEIREREAALTEARAAEEDRERTAETDIPLSRRRSWKDRSLSAAKERARTIIRRKISAVMRTE